MGLSNSTNSSTEREDTQASASLDAANSTGKLRVTSRRVVDGLLLNKANNSVRPG